MYQSVKICWQSAILPHSGIHLSLYTEKLSLKLISTLISTLRRDNIYGACPCIISKHLYIFIVIRELYLSIEIFGLIETLIKLYLQKEPPAIKTALKKASALQRWWREASTQVLSCEYCKIFKNIYFEEHLRTTASALNIVQNNLSYRIL